MATYGASQAGVKGMGIRGLAVRTAAVGLLSWAAVIGGPWAWDKLTNGNAPVEQGFVNYKSLDIEGKKNGAGNMEAYLQYEHGDRIDSLPCMEGYAGGVLCGTIDYLVENFTPQQREGVVVEQFPGISNEAKRGIVGSELQAMLDTFYGTQKTALQTAHVQYGTQMK